MSPQAEATPAGGFERLREIAAEIAVEEAPFLAAHEAFHLNSSFENSRALERATAEYSRKVQQYLPELAQVTGNAESTVRSIFSGEWFGVLASEFFQAVADYKSFDPVTWAREGWTGYQRSPHAMSLNRALGVRRSEARP